MTRGDPGTKTSPDGGFGVIRGRDSRCGAGNTVGWRRREASRAGREAERWASGPGDGRGRVIGSHLAERLVRDGHEVRVLVRYNGRDDRGQLDRLDPGRPAAVEVHRGDLKDPEAVRKAVRRAGVGASTSGP